MAATIHIDEINTPETFDAERFIEEYFRPMRISEERKEEREEAARSFRDFLLFIMALIAISNEYNTLNWAYIEEQFQRELERAALEYARKSQALEDYIAEKASDFVSITREKDLSDPYWTSDERATYEAVNEANDVVGYEELQQAIDDGYTHKEWKSERDSRVRRTHRAVDGKRIPIMDMFEVGDGFMRYPHDWYYNSKECYNCRCACLFIGNNSENEESRENGETDIDRKNVTFRSYREKYNRLNEDAETRSLLVNRSMEILLHRSGTRFEDIAYIDTINHKSEIRKDFDYYKDGISKCEPSESMEWLRVNAPKNTIIGIHNHPGSTSPSLSDLWAAQRRRYKYGLVLAHNGNVFKYSVKEDVDLFGANYYTYNRLIEGLKRAINGNKEAIEGIIAEFEKYGVSMEIL